MLHALLPFTLHESSFSRSYGGILPSSLTRVFPRTLGFSPRLPVSVLVRAMCLYLEAFLDSVGSITSLLSLVTRHHISAFRATDLPIAQPTCLNTHFQSRADLPYCVTPSIKRFTPVQEFQPVVHRLRFSPRLRSRLTLSRRSLLRNPRAFGGKDSHLSFRYSYRHSHFLFVHMSFRSCFFLIRTLPYP